MEREEIAKTLYLMLRSERPLLPDWESIPDRVRGEVTDELIRVAEIALKILILGEESDR
jgi:hypothetical protein